LNFKKNIVIVTLLEGRRIWEVENWCRGKKKIQRSWTWQQGFSKVHGAT